MGNQNNRNNNGNNQVQVQQQSVPVQQYQQPQTYAAVMIEQPQQNIPTTRNEMNFQQQPTNVQTNRPQVQQVHDTNAPTGPLLRSGINFCQNHRTLGTRCKFCLGQGCEWKQIFDPVGVTNPNVKPLKSYGEMMLERERQAQQGNQQNPGNSNYGNGNNNYGNNSYPRGNNNYGQRYQQPQQRYQQQQQLPQNNNAQDSAVNNVFHYSPPNSNNAGSSPTGSGNAQGAPTHPTGCQ